MFYFIRHFYTLTFVLGDSLKSCWQSRRCCSHLRGAGSQVCSYKLSRAAPALGKCSILLLLSGAGPWWVLRFVSVAFLKARLLAETACCSAYSKNVNLKYWLLFFTIIFSPSQGCRRSVPWCWFLTVSQGCGRCCVCKACTSLCCRAVHLCAPRESTGRGLTGEGQGSPHWKADINMCLSLSLGLCWALTAETWSFQHLWKCIPFLSLLQQK